MWYINFLFIVSIIFNLMKLGNLQPYFNLNEALSSDRICPCISSTKLSTKCLDQLKESCTDRNVLNTMLDASSKFPYPGLKVASKLDLGNFDECIDVNHKYNHGTILGKYCTFGLQMRDPGDQTNTSFFDLAICLPNACSANDYDNIFENVLSKNVSGVFNDNYCTTQEGQPYNTGFIIIMSVFLIFIIMMIISTAYDLFLHQSGRVSKNKLLIAFSVLTNGKSLVMCLENSKEQILVFQGFRLLSTVWIVFGHTTFLWKELALLNREEFQKYYSHWYAFYTGGYSICVDTFFYMSGFLLAYNYLKSESKSLATHIKAVPKFYIHRYLRVVPPMMMVYLMTAHLLVHMTNGPFNVINAKRATHGCEPLWPFFLFVQNYRIFPHMCLPQTWYLSADMQMYFLSPLIIIPLAMKLNRKEFKSSMVLLLLLNVIFYILPIVIELVISDPSRENYFETHPRFITFGCGIMMGTFMRVRKDVPFLSNRFNNKNTKIINLIIWIFTLLIMFAITVALNITHNGDYPRWSSIYLVLPRPLWCLGLSWITYSCYHGYGGIVNWMLTRSFMQVGGKISYSIYLLQSIPMFLYTNSLRSRIYLNVFHHTMVFWGILAISTALAFFWYLLFEAPVGVLDKFIFNKKVRKPAGESNGQNGGMS